MNQHTDKRTLLLINPPVYTASESGERGHCLTGCFFIFINDLVNVCLRFSVSWQPSTLDTQLNTHLHGLNMRWPYLPRQLFPSCKSSMLLFCTHTMICTFPEPQQRYKANAGLPGKQKILLYLLRRRVLGYLRDITGSKVKTFNTLLWCFFHSIWKQNTMVTWRICISCTLILYFSFL